MALELIAAFVLVVFVLSNAHAHLAPVHRPAVIVLPVHAHAALRDWPLHPHVGHLLGRRALTLHEPHPLVLQRRAVTICPLIIHI